MMSDDTDEARPRFFSIKPNLMGGRFLFYFGPWDRMDKLRDWYLAHGLTDEHHRIKDHQQNGQPDAGQFDGAVFDPQPGFPLLAMQAVPHTPAEIGDLAHEVHHAVQRWSEGLGIYTSRESEEVFAYVEGCLVTAVLDYLWHGTVLPGMDVEEDREGGDA